MKLHHVGYVVRDIAAYAAGLPGLTPVRTVQDPLQHAELALFEAGGCFIELIAPADSAAFTWGHLERHGEGLHHICYDAGSLAAALDAVRAHRMVKLRGPMPAPLFDRDVLFAVNRNRAIVEFVL